MVPNIRTVVDDVNNIFKDTDAAGTKIRCAVLGCGMMGREHISYILGYPNVVLSFLCDPHEPSLEKSLQVFTEFHNPTQPMILPDLYKSEEELLLKAEEIDLLVIATPNHLHTDTIIRWGSKDITILCEKPVSVSLEQHMRLTDFMLSASYRARVWVAMEYRYIPAIAKLLDLLPTIGDVKMVTIRENRFPFLHKVGQWNRDRTRTGDTLVEKCCHFFDLFRLITGQEVDLPNIKAIVQRGINYQDEKLEHDIPIVDSAYVIFPFLASRTMGCLELSMFADGSRHQEELVVTGTKGRIEAYLPENKVYAYLRPTDGWVDKSVPPPRSAIKETVYDCSDVKAVHDIKSDIPTHGGYHYSSTAVEWHRLINAIQLYHETGKWKPDVRLADGLDAVRIGLQATEVCGEY